jgi:hypothetical protein
VPPAHTLVRWVDENAFASIVQARPCPTFGRPVHQWDSSLDYGPVFLRRPFRFYLTIDTLPSETIVSASEELPPAFGYVSPHPRDRGTLTLLISVLPSTHYGLIRLPMPRPLASSPRLRVPHPYFWEEGIGPPRFLRNPLDSMPWTMVPVEYPPSRLKQWIRCCLQCS